LAGKEKAPGSASSKAVDYTTKDNNKLRNLLHARDLPESGTREEMIARLESNPIHHEQLTSAELTEMLKRSHVPRAAQGTKEDKIERLRQAEAMDHDSGSYQDGVLAGEMIATEHRLARLLKEREAFREELLPAMNLPQLRQLAKIRKIPSSGDQKTLAARLEADACKLSLEIQIADAEYKALQRELETSTGHPTTGSDVLERELQCARKMEATMLNRDKPPNDTEQSESSESSQREKVKATRDRQGKENSNGRDEATKGHLDYRTKDNSKLRTLLSDRGLSAWGTREEMITRLENSPIDYERFTSAEISDRLKRRGLTMAESGSKEIKIKRLLLNDELDYDTSNWEERDLYIQLSVKTDFVHEYGPEMLADIDRKYSSWNAERLHKLLKERKLSCSGDKTVLVQRLRADDRKTLTKKLGEAKEECKLLKAKLESLIGHSLQAVEDREAQREHQRRDIELQMSHKPTRLGPICDYNWKDSHWASRTERQLREICARREMPGAGPKAAMLKWLDTGEVEYTDLYVHSLEQMCRKRGLRVKSGATRGELAKLLREADEMEDEE
jgi:hypothetical protein